MTDAEDGESVSRRGFLRATAGAGAVAAASGTAEAQQSKTVEMTDSLTYEPAELTVAPGTTVIWENAGSMGHTVTAYGDQIPDDSTYFASGGFDGEEAARANMGQGMIDGDGTYEHTFDTTGTYEYFCIPHEGSGMTGTVTVQEGGAQTGGGSSQPVLPGSAKMAGVVSMASMIATLGFAYILLKYGGDYGEVGE